MWAHLRSLGIPRLVANVVVVWSVSIGCSFNCQAFWKYEKEGARTHSNKVMVISTQIPMYLEFGSVRCLFRDQVVKSWSWTNVWSEVKWSEVMIVGGKYSYQGFDRAWTWLPLLLRLLQFSTVWLVYLWVFVAWFTSFSRIEWINGTGWCGHGSIGCQISEFFFSMLFVVQPLSTT